ncbi:glutathione S-transferase family protein [Xanthobacter agilis]|uniref:Glutathione S-transferase n=1 Tax=Xanthobacter agilis TaxID=47492 RepID=A0ABU0LCM5_XANAG|nr:glutathione S-transferase [Xanthobacter agilis]MDQ0504904.1 glutathione S-transferase [Xanthobacter agilis]
MQPMKLYCFAQSGNAYRAALMLQVCDVPWEPVFVDFFNGETRTAAFRAEVNEMGEVPVLVDGDLRLSQSGVILDYLAHKTGRFLPDTEAERREALRWILFDNHKFTSYFATLRFMVALSGQSEGDVTAFLRLRAMSAYGIVDAHLARSDFLVGAMPTYADVSLAGYVFYPERAGVELAQFPHLERWAARIAALPGWVHPYDLMPGHPLPPRAA